LHALFLHEAWINKSLNKIKKFPNVTPSSSDPLAWNPQLSSIASNISSILPPEVWKGIRFFFYSKSKKKKKKKKKYITIESLSNQLISPGFYLTFWQLSLYDIFVPVERYKEQIAKQERHIQELDESKDSMQEAKKKKEKDRCQSIIDKLKKELQDQNDNHKFTMKRLEYEKHSWIHSGPLFFLPFRCSRLLISASFISFQRCTSNYQLLPILHFPSLPSELRRCFLLCQICPSST